MSDRLTNNSIPASLPGSADFITNILKTSTEYSIIGKGLDGTILHWNEGARRLYGYEPEEVIGLANADILHTPEDVASGQPGVMRKAAMRDGLWEGAVKRVRKDGRRFRAQVVLTPRHDANGKLVGFLMISKETGTNGKGEIALTVDSGPAAIVTEVRRAEALLKAGALQSAIFNSANFSSIATDAKGVIQIFNVGAERMLGYTADEVVNKITPADISDPQEVIARAAELTRELGTPITPGFEALVFKASRGIEDIYELTYIRKDGSRFPAVVSVTALRDAQDGIIGYLLIGTDNTARKQAEEALRENYALLRTIHLHSIVSVTDQAGRIVDANEGFCKISGYSREELIGQTHRIVNSGVQDRAFWTDMWHSITAGQPWRGEICNRTKDGALYWVDSIIAPYMAEDGQTKRYISVRTDVTARKQAEQALLKAGALQNAIFNSANFSSIATDANGVIQIFNVGAERMMGYTAAEVVNKITPADISDPQEVIVRAEALSVELGTPIAPGFEALVFKASRGIEDIYELTYFRKDGSRFPAVVSVTALRDAQDAIIGYLLIATDNTARKQAEEARARFFAISRDLFCTIGFDGYFKDLNPAWEKTLGYTRAELLAVPFIDLIHPDDRQATAGEADKISAGNSLIAFENRYQCKDGSYRTLLWSATPDIGNQLMYGAARDVTEARQAEAMLLKAGALQNAIFNSANFSSIATDAKGVIQIFNVGAERMLGYTAAEVMNKITPADISDPQEVIARAKALSAEAGTPITPGFEALVFKASRGIEDIYELTYFRKDGSRFPAVVSVTALRDAQDAIIGYLLIGTDNTARKQAEEALLKAGALQNAIFNSANFSSIATDAKGVIQIFNVGAERMLGYTADEVVNKITPADISDPQEVIVRAEALSAELGTLIAPGFEALVFKASRGIEDIYELTYFRKDGSRFPAVVSVTALRDAQDAIIGYLLIGTDNTARKHAEEELLKAGALQRAIFNSANFSSIATDAKGVIQIFNVGAERMLGYTAAEVMNKITPADISDPQEVIARAKALSTEAGTPITPGFEALVFKASRGIEDIYELTYFRKDGSRFPAVVSVTALRDAQDAIIGYLLIGTDNTARKRAEEALLKAGALQNAIFNSANFSSIATDAKGVIQIFNVGAEKMLGYKAAEVMNKITPADISDPQELIVRAKALSVEVGSPITPGFEALVFKASRGIEDIYELTYFRKDGSRFPAVVSVTALRDDQGGIIGYLLIGTDNTARQEVEAERKKLDQRLRDQQFYTRSLIESNIDALMTTDPLGIITDVNKQMEALTDCTRDELIGAPFKNYFTDPDRAEAGIRLVLGEKKVTNYELTACSRDGKKTEVSYNATTFYDRDRKLQGVFAAARDVTERKRFEQTLQEKNIELESANLAKDRFLASMSHELRTPLNAIIGFTGTLLMKLPGPLNGDQSQQLSTVQGSARHLLSLINDLLDLAKIESGKVEIKYEPIVCQSVVEEVAAALMPLAENKGLDFQVSAPKGSVRVESDRRILSQILINLTNNAIKFTDQGKVRIVLGTRKVDVHSLATIEVIDTGVGIRPEDKEKLFQAFQQVDIDRRGEGTGLGLYLSQKLAVLIKGRIELESEYGKGSVFRLLIPQD